MQREGDRLEEVDATIAEHGKVSILVHIKEHMTWTAEAGWDDLKWLKKYLHDLNKFAIVSHSTVYKVLTAMDAPFAKMNAGIEEKHFNDLDEAWEWLKS